MTPAVRSALFPDRLPEEGNISPVAVVTDAVHLVGISLSTDLRFAVAFLKAEDLSGGDAEHLMSMASRWTVFLPDCPLDPSGRVIKFFRADAVDDPFDPRLWLLPKPFTIWQFQDALVQTVAMYAQEFPSVRQFFYMAQTASLEGWYSRIERYFRAPGLTGLALRVIARPAADQGGFHGYERI